jgi:hypothetical protein
MIMILQVWDDTPWNYTAIRGHGNMSTLVRIPTGHMRFVPAHRQTNVPFADLSLAKWPLEFVLIANAMGRKAFLSQDRIHAILAPAMQATCRLKPE